MLSGVTVIREVLGKFMSQTACYIHPQIPRRVAVQAGAIGLLGLGMNVFPLWHTVQSSVDSGNFRPPHKADLHPVF